MSSRLASLIALVVTWSVAAAADPVALTGRAMGTTWSAKFLPPPPPAPPLDPALLTARIAATLEHLENLFSTYRPDSELSRFNASSSLNWIPVSPELAHVALESRRISELTAGAFDATLYPLVELWGFGPTRRTTALPTDGEIAIARARVDYRRLEIRLTPPALRKTLSSYPSSSAISTGILTADFSSMAKGFAADSLGELLTSLGAPDHIVQIGGDIKTSGTHVWRTGIEQPTAPAIASAATSPSGSSTASPTTLARVVALAGQSLSTSGDTHNFTILAGQRYGHIIDPRTGRPAASSLASVSVIHSLCATSSALATALVVLGPDAGYALALHEHLACLFIVRDGAGLTHRTTPEFERFTSPSPR